MLRRGRSDGLFKRSDKLALLGGRDDTIERADDTSDRFTPISRQVSDKLRTTEVFVGPSPRDPAEPGLQELTGDRIGVLENGTSPDFGLVICVPHVIVVTSLRSV